MKYDQRFALIDRDGDPRYPEIIDGTYQIGKARDAKPTDLTTFARAILVEELDGRFSCLNGRKRLFGKLDLGDSVCA